MAPVPRTVVDFFQIAPVQALLRRRYEHQFQHWPGAFRGVYATFAEATAAAPPGKQGYDHPEMATIYDDLLDSVRPADYASMFWLQHAFDEGAQTVFDFGGHIGIAYYAYRTRMRFPNGLAWRVCDVPAVAERGRALAAAENAADLSFTIQFAEATEFDVLFAKGSLQYIEAPLPRLLRELDRLPRHLLVNNVPLTDGRPFVTLQHTVHAYNPYAIFNRQELLEGLDALDYELIDSWRVPDKSCVVPFQRASAVNHYSGLYLRRRE